MYTPTFDYTRYHPTHIADFAVRDLRHEKQVATNLVWLHRWFYYIIGESIITDDMYDRLERHCRTLYRGKFRRLPARHPLRCVGSSMPESYPPHIQTYFAKRAHLRRDVS